MYQSLMTYRDQQNSDDTCVSLLARILQGLESNQVSSFASCDHIKIGVLGMESPIMKDLRNFLAQPFTLKIYQKVNGGTLLHEIPSKIGTESDPRIILRTFQEICKSTSSE